MFQRLQRTHQSTHLQSSTSIQQHQSGNPVILSISRKQHQWLMTTVYTNKGKSIRNSIFKYEWKQIPDCTTHQFLAEMKERVHFLKSFDHLAISQKYYHQSNYHILSTMQT